MKNKKIFFLLILVLIIILISLYFIIKNFKAQNSTNENQALSEYTPEEEISSKQMRETTVTLYFIDSNNNIKSEGKLIDSVNLLQNPYKQLIELLLSGPQNDGLINVFPENTKILDAKLNIISCTLNTLKQLNEVNSIKILVNGDLNNSFQI